MEQGAPKEWFSAPPLVCISNEPVVDGACAGVDRVSCKDPLPSGKCTYDWPQSSKEIPHPSFRVLPPESGSWDNAKGFELTSVGKCRSWMKN